MENDIILCGLNLHYEETGPDTGRPVVLMHGWGCTHHTVKSVARILETGMKVYNLDLPGFGNSSEPPESWGVPEYGDLVKKFIESKNLKDPVLIGHSFGGRVAIWLNSRNPWSKMVLIDAAGMKPHRTLKQLFKLRSFKIAKKFLPLLLGRKLGDKLIFKWRNKFGSSDYRNSSPVMRTVMSRATNQILTPLLPSIKASTLLIWGKKDTATPISDAKLMERRIPDAGLVVFPEAGHYSFLDEPAQFAAVMRSFFKNELNSGVNS